MRVKTNPRNSDPLALGLGVGIPPTRLVAASVSSAADPTAKEIKGREGGGAAAVGRSIREEPWLQ